MATIKTKFDYTEIFEKYPIVDGSVIVLCSQHLSVAEQVQLYAVAENMGFVKGSARYLMRPEAARVFVDLLYDPEFHKRKIDLYFILYKDYWNHSTFSDLTQAIYKYKKATGQDVQPFLDALKKTYRGEYIGMGFQYGDVLDLLHFRRTV